VSLVRLRPVWITNHSPSVLWHCWLGHQTCKNRRPYNLCCVGAYVKPCSINQSATWEVFKSDLFWSAVSPPFCYSGWLQMMLVTWATASCFNSMLHLIRLFANFADSMLAWNQIRKSHLNHSWMDVLCFLILKVASSSSGYLIWLYCTLFVVIGR